MSHPLYNPHAPGNQNSTQGQYGLLGSQAERDSQRAPSRLGPGSSFRSSGASSVTPVNPVGRIPSLMSQPMVYRPDQMRPAVHQDIDRSIDMHISRAREDVRAISTLMHQSKDQGTHFATSQRDDFRSSGSGTASYQMSSTPAPLGHRHSDAERGSTSLDWSSDYKRATSGDSKPYSSTASSDYASSSDGRFNASSKRERDMQSNPGSGDYGRPVTDKHAASSESSQPKYTSESAADILLHFGLEKEDLEQLVSYPDDQMTPHNLSFILRQIRIQKSQRAKAADQPAPYIKPQPTRSVRGMDSLNLSTSEGAGTRQEEKSSTVLQPSKVIDYGHTGKYTGGVGDEIRRTSDSRGGSRGSSGGSGSMLAMDSYDSRHSGEQRQRNSTEVRSTAFGSLHEQASSDPSVNSLFSSVRSSYDQTKQLQAQLNQTPQAILSSFSLPAKDTDMRVPKSEAASRPVPLREPGRRRQSSLDAQPSSALFRGVHPGRPGLVLIGSNDAAMTQSTGQGSTEMKSHQQTQKQQKQPRQQQSKQQMQTQKQPVSQTGQAAWPLVFPPQPSLLPGVGDAARPMQQQGFHPGDPRPVIIPPPVPQTIPSLLDFVRMGQLTSDRQPPAKVPMLAVMHDYTAASPRVFPHTCSLCNTECAHTKDWISHQNTTLHLENCKRLRQRYPEWDGELTLAKAAGQDAKPSTSTSTSTSAQTPQHRQRTTSHGSRSHSRSSSPRRRHRHHRHHHHHSSSEGRREKRGSLSRSPHDSRYTRRSRSRSHSPRNDWPTSSHYRSRSMSSERRLSPWRRDDKWSSPKRSGGIWSSQRSREKPAPMRTDKTRSPPRRSDEKQPLQKRNSERRLPTKKNDMGRSSQRKSHERQLSKQASSPQRKKSSSAESLAKKLLETSAVQSLSKQSDLEAMVKTLAPALLAELAKMKSSSSSSSSSTTRESTSKPSKAKPSQQKSETSSSTKSGKPSPANMVKLQGVRTSLSHQQVVASLERFGKTKSVVLFRSTLEAIVYFEKEEDAKKVNSMKSFVMKGMPVSVVTEQKTNLKEQTKPPQKKHASVSKPQTAKSTTTTTKKKVLHPPPKISGTKKVGTGKPAAAKGSVKGLKTESKVLVSKAKNIQAMKRKAEWVKTGKLSVKGAVKKAMVKPKSSQSVLKKSETSVKESVGVQKETTKADKSKASTSKAEMSATQKTKPPVGKSSAAGAVAKGRVVSMPSKSTASKGRPNKGRPKPKGSQTKTKGTVVVLKETSEDVEPKHQAKLLKAENTKEEPMETTTTTESVPEKSMDSRPNDCAPPTSTDETSLKAQSEPESEQAKVKPEAAEIPIEAGVDAKLPGGGLERDTVQTGPRPDSSSVTQVEEKYSTISPDSGRNCDITIKVEPDTIKVLSTTSSDVAMDEDGEKPGTSPAPIPEEISDELPQIDVEFFKALTEAVRQHRLTQENRPQSEEGQGDITSDFVSSDVDLFDEQNFNMEDFVTVDEVGTDVGDASPEPPSSSPSSSRERRKRQSSSVASGGKQTSTRSSRYSKSSAASSSEPTKSSTKLQTSAGAGKAPSCSSSVSLEPPSSTVCETPDATVEALSKQSKPRGAVTKSDRRVSAEGFAPKPVESSEIHPPPQGHVVELSQAQTLEIDCNINTLKDRKKSKEEGKEDDVDKHTEEGNSGNDQNFDSIDQTDSQMDNETQQNQPETLLEGGYQVLDSIHDEGKVSPQDYSEMKIERSLRSPKEDNPVQEKSTTTNLESKSDEKGDESIDEVVSEVVDSATTERTGRRRSARGKTDASENLEIEDKIGADKQTVTTRATRGKRESTSKKDASDEKTKGEVVNDDQSTTGPKRKKGRPKKVVKTTERDTMVVKDTETATDEEEVMYRIIDSVEEETVGDQLPTGSAKNEEEEEPMYQIVDSLDDDQEELTATEVSDRGKNKNSNESPARQEVSPDDIPTCGATGVFVEKESLYKVVDASEEVQHDPSAPEGSGTKSEEGTAKKDSKKEDNSTLDEFVEEEAKKSTHAYESLESLDPETLVTLDEAGGDEEEKPVTSRSTKRKHDVDTGDGIDFVTVDEVGEVEEEVVAPRTRGRPKKKNKRAPVRKSTISKKVISKEPADAPPPSLLDKDPSASASASSDDHKTEPGVEASAGPELQADRTEDQTLEGCVEEGSRRAAVKDVSKQRRDPIGPEAKRSRSQSPCVATNFKLPAFKPNNPLGQEFMVPKLGSFCNLCQVFCFNESTAKDLHCSSQTHYDNLQKHHQKQSRGSKQTSQGSVSH